VSKKEFDNIVAEAEKSGVKNIPGVKITIALILNLNVSLY